MISSQGTQVQRWSKGLSISLIILVIVLHVGTSILVFLFSPGLLQADRFQGSHCQSKTLTGPLSCDGCENFGCVSKSEGEMVSLSNLMMSFKFPRENNFNVWNWKLTGSLSIFFKVFGDDLITDQNENSSLVNLAEFKQSVVISSSIDYALNSNLEDSDAESFSSAWHSKARIRNKNRTMHCRNVPSPDQADTGEVSELSFLCVIYPLLELFPISNSTYITSLSIEKLIQPSAINLVETNGTLISYLSVITESQGFHEIRFYIKCVFLPLLLFSLVWFMVRLCRNDLYINIPDRLVITAGLAQVVNNIPLELIVSQIPIPHLILLEYITQILTFSVLVLFWIIFTLDKLADNEPWERTTRYYWRCITSVILGCVLALTTFTFLCFPFLHNPFNNHWQEKTTYVSLGLIFCLAVGVACFQSYLAIISFRVICDISIQ